MAHYAVELTGVTKRFGDVVALDNVSLQIRNGEFFSLLGPSGCGKTTTLRIIAGFETPTEGEIFIQGQPMGHIPPFQRDTNMVFQNYALFPHMTVAENVAFGLEMKRLSRDEIARRIKEVLELVRLSGMEDRKPHQLSGGQQQRVALARALVNRPSVLLLDEPLGSLDLKLRKAMQLELKSLQHQVGITFIYVTHDQQEALTMSDRIAVMDQGRVLQVGTPAEIYERPNCRFVADFIGETNFLEGRVAAREGRMIRVIVDDQLPILASASGNLSPGTWVTVAVRPEKIRLLDTSSNQNANTFPGHVEEVVYLGTDTYFHVRLSNGALIRVRQQNFGSLNDHVGSLGAHGRVYVTWAPESVLVLSN
jgi:spermidine/putrescine transport system ATP-binding protein